MESSPGSSRKNLINFLTHLDSKRFFVLLVTLLLLFSTFSTYYFSNRLFVKSGDIASSDYFSKITIRYKNQIKTEELRKKAEEKVPVPFKIDPRVTEEVEEELADFKNRLISIRNDKLRSFNDKNSEVSKLLNLSSSQQGVSRFLINSDEKTLNQIFEVASNVLSIVLKRGVREIDITEYSSLAKTIDDKIALSESRENNKQIVALLIQKKIRFNMFVDEDAKRIAITLAREKIVPVFEDITPNQKIISKGQLLTEEDIDKLKAIERLSTSQNWIQWTKAGFYSLLLIIFMLYFLWITNRAKYLLNFDSFVLLNALLFLLVLSFRIIFILDFTN